MNQPAYPCSPIKSPQGNRLGAKDSGHLDTDSETDQTDLSLLGVHALVGNAVPCLIIKCFKNLENIYIS